MANYATSSLKLSDTYVNTLPYNTCSTAAGTAAKTVSAGDFSLETGAMVVVKFTVTNTAANPTLNVSSTGAKAIYYNGAAITAGYLKANKVYQFIYNGTQWDLVGDVDTNTTYTIPTTLKNPNALTVQGNGTTSFTYDGSAAKTLNIKAGSNVSVTSDTSGNITIAATDTNTTYSVVSTSADGLAPKRDGSTTKFLRADGTWAVPPDTNTNTNYYHTPSYTSTAASNPTGGSSSNIKIGTGSGVNDLYIPVANGSTPGVTIVYPAASCTTFTSDSGTCTPAAVKKAVGMFNPKAHTHAAGDITGLAAVATSGSYKDLSNTPIFSLSGTTLTITTT